MRSGASAVQHLLSPAALGVLKHAVTEARRRGHPQVQPLHVVSMLLTHAGSRLRQACMLSHPQNSQTAECRALEVCFNVALDHLPQSAMAAASQPILSNALMAALKRAHAHQRRGCPEHQHSPLLAVKVEIDQLIISILDDPSVSRVMKEAGFSSTNVKFNLEDGPASAAAAAGAVTVVCGGGHGVYEPQPSKHGADIVSQGASFFENSCVGQEENETKSSVKMPPGVMSQSTSLNSWQQSEESLEGERREMVRASCGANTGMVGPAVSLPSREEDIRNMVEILLSPSNRNALLIGDTAMGANSVVEDLASRLKTGLVPKQLAGLQFLDPKLSLSSFSHCSSLQMEQNLAELSKIVEECMPDGAILHIGDLQWLAEPMQLKKSPSNFCPAQRTAAELGNLLARHAKNRLWFVGVVTPHTFARLQVLHPSLASEWKLQSMQVTTTAFQPPQTHFLQRFSSNLQQPVTDQQTPKVPLPVRGSSPMVASVPVMQSSRYPGITQVSQMHQCCADCLSKFEEECRQLRENESLSLQLAPNKWLSSNDEVTSGGPNGATSHTKNPPAVRQVAQLLQKWKTFCRIHHGEAPSVPTRLPSPQTRLPASSYSKPCGLGLDVSSQWSSPQDRHLGSSVVDQPLRTPLSIPLYMQAARDKSPLSQRTSEVIAAPTKPSEAPDFTSPKDGSSVASAPEGHEDLNLSTGTSAQDAAVSIQTNLALGRANVPGKLRAQLQSQVSPLQPQLRPLQSQPRPLQSQPRPLQSQLRPLQSQPSPLQSQLRPLQSQPSPLQSQSSPLQSQSSPLQSQLRPLQSQPSPLQSQLRPLQSQPSPPQSQPSPLQSLRSGASPLKTSSGNPAWLTQSPSPLQRRPLGGAPTHGFPAWSASPLASRQARVTKSPSPPPMPLKEVTVAESLKGLYKGMMQRVPWQGSAIAGIAATVMKCRGGESGFRGQTAKTDTWLLLLGPDPVAKHAIARALAEMVYGGEQSLIHLGFAPRTRHKLEADDSGVRYRALTPLDRLAEAVRLKPNAVILLEDIDQADSLMRKGVQRAMEIGKLADSHRREVSFSNTIVVMTTSIGSELCEPTGALTFSEAKLACLTNRPSIRGSIKDSRSEKMVFEMENQKVAVVEREIPQQSAPSSSPNSLLPTWVSKRKPDAVLNMQLQKRAKPSLNLDLNLSSGWTGESDQCDDEDSKLQMVLAKARSALTDKFCALPDYAVSFEAYDFHRLATDVLSKLGKVLELHGPREVALEVDHQLLEYIISCVWRIPEGQQAFTTWLEDVFAKSLADSRLCGGASVVELALEDNLGDGGSVALPRRVVYDDFTSF